METTIDLTDMPDDDLRRLAQAIAEERERRAAAREPAYYEIGCRRKDLNCKGRGEQETRRVRMPDGRTGWASDLARNLSGHWSAGSYRANDRRCEQTGEFPVGTIVVAFRREVGRSRSPAQVRAGVLGEDGEIDWSLPVSRTGSGASTVVRVRIDGEWITV